MSEEIYEKLIQTEELARILGIKERTAQMLAKKGVITCRKVGGKNAYNLYQVVREYVDYTAKKGSKTFSSADARKLDEETRLKKIKADIAELELEELRGNLHAAADVEDITTDLVMAVRSAVLALPGTLAMDIIEAKSPAEASEIIKKAVHNILEELADYKYDPDEYRRRVREKQGWQNDRDEDTG